MDQLNGWEDKHGEKEEQPLREIKTADLQRILYNIELLMNKLSDIDWERSAKTKRKIKPRQSTLDRF